MEQRSCQLLLLFILLGVFYSEVLAYSAKQSDNNEQERVKRHITRLLTYLSRLETKNDRLIQKMMDDMAEEERQYHQKIARLEADNHHYYG